MNLAARLESAGFPGCVLLSESTYRMVITQMSEQEGLQSNFQCIEKMFIKGKEPQRVWLWKLENQKEDVSAA